ncbi:uncharacterized protein [Aegilops tauschii subsp. strangulata]|uniref:uncharacterized protein n=1 Tax=Aegilops tauschii subsp. strangulata TaxID=200361 RepID=UPI00098ACF7B|nr:uncharacterized protein LOC109751095 [Aegilops tauschii subsp. strangulata]
MNRSLDWLQLLLIANPEEVRRKIMLVLWQSWNLRNSVIHGDGKETVSGVVQGLLRLHADLIVADDDPLEERNKNKLSTFPTIVHVPLQPGANYWGAPPSDAVKLNIDAAFLHESGEAWGGAVARDHLGRVLMSIGKRLDRCHSAEEAEGAAVELGITTFAGLFRGHIILETDCASIGGLLQSAKWECRSACRAVLANAKRQMYAFSSWEVSIVNRNKNSLAHELAAIARRTGDFSLIAMVPDDAIAVMMKEIVTTMV